MRKDDTIHIRIEQPLNKWLADYCRKRKTTKTDIITNYIRALRVLEYKERGDEAK
jgi:hypothetical protein